MKFHFNLTDTDLSEKVILTPSFHYDGGALNLKINGKLVAWFEEEDGKLKLWLIDSLDSEEIGEYFHLTPDGEIKTV